MKRIVAIKIGSSTLVTQRNKVDEFRVAHVAEQVVSLHKAGVAAVLIISGAVACGAGRIRAFSVDDKLKRVAAGVGQVYLIATLQRIFAAKNLEIAQILLTENLFDSEAHSSALKQVLDFYLHARIVPIINENDVMDLNSFGGNDLLVTKIAALIGADQVLILSRMKVSLLGVGGKETKQHALSLLEEEHVRARIVDGKTKTSSSRVFCKRLL